jgi:hypothetical protein
LLTVDHRAVIGAKIGLVLRYFPSDIACVPAQHSLIRWNEDCDKKSNKNDELFLHPKNPYTNIAHSDAEKSPATQRTEQKAGSSINLASVALSWALKP